MQKTALMLDVGVGNGVDGGSLKMYFQPLYRHRKNNQKFMASLQGAPENSLTVLTCNTLCKKNHHHIHHHHHQMLGPQVSLKM